MYACNIDNKYQLFYTRNDHVYVQIVYHMNSSHTHTRLTALCPGLPRWAGTRKVKPIWILLKQEAVSGSGISWAICKSAHRSRQITTPASHHSDFYRPDALQTNNHASTPPHIVDANLTKGVHICTHYCLCNKKTNLVHSQCVHQQKYWLIQ